MDKRALLTGVNMLVTHNDASLLYESMTALARLPEHLLIGLIGEASELTPLVDLRRRDPERFESVMALIESKRREALLAPLQDPERGFDKVEYQRQFMDQKRQRERRAADLENAVRPERDRLIGNARLEFMRTQGQRWKKRRDEMMIAAREAAGGHLTKEQQTQVLQSFWGSVDAELDELEVSVRRRGLGLGSAA